MKKIVKIRRERLTKILLVIMLMVMAFGSLSRTVSAESWAGSGTELSPYLISNATELAKIGIELENGENFDNTYFRMTNDIDLDVAPYNTGEGWEPIGTIDHPFTGVFDGNGFAIKNIMINRSSILYVGLFGYSENSKIMNLGIESGSIKGGGNHTTFSNVGSLVGVIKKGEIINCYNKASVTSDDTAIKVNVGGISGDNKGGFIINCYNAGTVSAPKGGDAIVGGITGSNQGTSSQEGGTISNCFNMGNISNSSGPYIGGISGRNMGTFSSITDCYNTGVLYGSTYFGGIVGQNVNAKITNCYNNAKIELSVPTSQYVGGVIGTVSGPTATISNCYFNKDNYTGPAIGQFNLQASTDNATNVIGMTTEEMLNGDMTLSNEFLRNEPDMNNRYYPELKVFAQSSSNIINTASKLSVVVEKLDITVTFPTNLTATYGQTLADVSLSSGVGNGTFSWKAVNSTSVGNAGDNQFTVLFTPTEPKYKSLTQNVTISVSKATQTAPNAPTITSKTSTSITLNAIVGAEYSINGTDWQDNLEFNNLTPNTEYTFYARLKEISNYFASPSSLESAIIKTDALVYEDADYTAVDTALAKIPTDLSVYTDETVTALNNAKNAVVLGKNITEQATVTGYATAIEDAITALVYKDADYTAVDAALAKIPTDLSVYTDETVTALNNAKNAVVLGKNITEQVTVTGYATAIQDAIDALVLEVIDITDNNTKIKISANAGVIPANSELIVKVITTGSDFNKATLALKDISGKFMLYDISIMSDGVKVDINENVTVSILIPTDYDKAKLAIYYIDEKGKSFEIESKVEGDYLVFSTTHFGNYAIVDTSVSAPNTGDTTVILSFLVMNLFAMANIILLNERKKYELRK